MTIAYHSQNRKELVKTISEIIGIPAVYQFMPTCAYQIGECYTVTKSGDLKISDQADRKETERLLTTVLSFPCSANLPRTRAASTASQIPPTIPSTPCGVS